MGIITATRYHDFCAGHTVNGHESKCAHLHGHNYRVYFTVTADDSQEAPHPVLGLDALGRVIDFSVIKERLCYWLEANWDHKFLIWAEDPRAVPLTLLDTPSMVLTPFNPTAENMAKYLVEHIGPAELIGLGVSLISVTIEETRKCSAEYKLGSKNDR